MTITMKSNSRLQHASLLPVMLSFILLHVKKIKGEMLL